MRKIFLLFFLMLSIGIAANAQNRTVTGTVIGKDDKAPLIGVTITVKGSATSTATDVNGKFSIKVTNLQNVVIGAKYLGYEYQEITLKPDVKVVDFTLSPTNSNLNEVIVVGYGTKKRSEVIGGVATIKAEEIADIPAPNIAGALRNRIAGLGVSQTSGRPGATISLNVRNSQISSNSPPGVTTEPLYVIDGVISTTDQFNAIDPSLVEDLTILKDASAAIYGASGSKGVILITTKKGKVGKPKFTYNGYTGISDAVAIPKMLSAYQQAKLINDNLDQQGFASASSYFSQADLDYLKTAPYKSWFDELWKPAVMQRHNLQMSGGTEKLLFFVGGSFQNEDANYAGMRNTKYGFRSGITATFSESLKADVSFNLNYGNKYSNNDLGTDQDQAFFQSLITTPQWIPIQINGMPVSFNKNPLGITNSGYFESKSNSDYTLNAALTYTPKPIPGLSMRFQMAQNGTAGHSTAYTAPYKQYDFVKTGNNNALYTQTLLSVGDGVSAANARYEPIQNYANRYQADITVNYAKSIGKNSISVLLGGEQSQSSSENLDIYFQNQIIPNQVESWAFDPALTFKSNTKSESIKQSFFGRFSYDFSKKYFIDAIGRFDASTNFATDNAWGFFPNVGLAWIISEEGFFKNFTKLDFISFLKVKANFGLTGDDRIQSRLWQATYTVDPANTGYVYNNTNAPSANVSAYPNPDITWEKKRSLNIGLEASMFKGQFTFGFDYFHDYAYDQFDKNGSTNFPYYAGFPSQYVNNENHHTYGTEFTLGYNHKFDKGLSFSSSVNFGFSTSYVSQVFQNPYQYFQNTPTDWQISQGVNTKVYNTGNIGLISKGILKTQADVDALLKKNPNYTIYKLMPEPGWLDYEDTNNDGHIDDFDMVPMYKNGTDPVLNLGWNFGLDYKGLSLRTNVVSRFGGHVFYDSKALVKPTLTVNVPAYWNDHWSPQNPDGMLPRSDDASAGKNSTFWARSATLVRINNMSLAYTLPSKWLARTGLSSLRVIVTGNNLWTIVNPLPYKDPYTSSIYDYPTIRTISAGLTLGL
ncbi:SusC/RagA family TonB-linked outer membrane protein [Mucilaginibacter sp. HMF5004]|uniref:SusC/RagA family TonB-linked outer membrane protein n=1 Tax=Mucilaginibacter rivuli TaxID=2857527 RepID=UPI001C5FDDCA|nr:SusC/RagA family TonB-linked outer membrane protein [Mucilaginibacter rivuli]MBW4889018.1 SusC/RagA family TonB-linked outer membrane protein [Mucilaginibacter rivuli]